MNGRRANGIWRKNSHTMAIARKIDRMISQRPIDPPADSAIESVGRHTQILHVLVPSHCQRTPRLASHSTGTGTVGLVDDDAVRDCRSDESGPIGETSPPGVRVESDVRKSIAECAKEEREVPNKPPKSWTGKRTTPYHWM